MKRLLDIMARLRDPEKGCPWDQAQDFKSIVPHTLEEAYEVADVIEGGRFEALRSELGDLLFQVVFYTRLAAERGWFDFEGVAAAIADKLTARHPHVFGETSAGTAAELSLQWEQHKERERRQPNQDAGVLDGIALALPAMSRAIKLQKRAARAGFDWGEPAPVLAKVREELGEVEEALADTIEHRTSEIGDLLFACINLARHAGVEPEQALRGANGRFERRFRYIEEKLRGQGRALTDANLPEMDALWEQAKREERGTA
jgi:ATP diphosphatase